MAIPVLNPNGFLPWGIHVATIEEIRPRFAAFQSSDRRVQLFRQLEQLVTALRKSGRFAAIIVDGSFVTAKPAPEDFDLIVVLRADHDWKADLSPVDYALVSRPALRTRFGFDILLTADGDENYERYVEFFSRVREDVAIRKGMLRVEL